MTEPGHSRLQKELESLRRRVAELERAETRQRETEKALRESEERHRTLLEKHSDGIAVVADGKLIYANPILCEMMRRSRDEVMGMSPTDCTVPEDRERLQTRINVVLAGGEAYPSEYHLLREDGTTLAVEGISRAIQYDGKPALLSVIRDITERKRAEEALRESEERYRALYNDNPSMYFTVDKNGVVMSVNNYGAEQLGYTVDELVGKNVLGIFYEDDKRAIGEQLKKCLANPNVVHHWEFRKVCKGGRIMWVREAARAVKGSDGEPLVLVFCEDITARKRAEEERRQLEAQFQHAQKLESLGILAGGIAHDFNNLLVGILGTSGMTLADESLSSTARQNIKEIEKTAQRAAELCRQLLAYSGRGRFVVRPINLSEVIEDMAHLLKVSVSKDAVLSYELDPALPTIEADLTQIQQIVMNLVGNASDAIGDRVGAIRISTGGATIRNDEYREGYEVEQLADGDYVCLEVTDTGIGIDAETLPKIFDPFFSTKSTGRGLGLAAALGIVRGHHGSVRVHSEPGRGTTFRILFPQSERAAKTASPSTTGQDEQWSGSGTVLVIDDEETVRSVAGRMLRQAGFKVLTASDGYEGIRNLREHGDEIKVVLLDMTMPRLSGEETFRQLRRIKSDVRVILSSGYDEQEATHRFRGEGLEAFIQKPYRPQELMATVRQVLEA